jgi:hypothetical protein
MSTILIMLNQFQSHEYNLDCAKITNKSRVYYLGHLFYSALKSVSAFAVTLAESNNFGIFFGILSDH